MHKAFVRSSNIYETFRPFYIVLKVFGFMTFRVSRRNEKGPSTTFFDGLLLGFWVSSYLFLFTMNMLWGQREPDAESSLLIKHGWHKLYLLEMFVVASVVVFNFIHRNTIVDCLRLIDQFDLVQVTWYYRLWWIFHLSQEFFRHNRNSDPKLITRSSGQQLFQSCSSKFSGSLEKFS